MATADTPATASHHQSLPTRTACKPLTSIGPVDRVIGWMVGSVGMSAIKQMGDGQAVSDGRDNAGDAQGRRGISLFKEAQPSKGARHGGGHPTTALQVDATAQGSARPPVTAAPPEGKAGAQRACVFRCRRQPDVWGARAPRGGGHASQRARHRHARRCAPFQRSAAGLVHEALFWNPPRECASVPGAGVGESLGCVGGFTTPGFADGLATVGKGTEDVGMRPPSPCLRDGHAA
eukprot:263114-Chlamydomonas_euryale.AAC.3